MADQFYYIESAIESYMHHDIVVNICDTVLLQHKYIEAKISTYLSFASNLRFYLLETSPFRANKQNRQNAKALRPHVSIYVQAKYNINIFSVTALVDKNEKIIK